MHLRNSLALALVCAVEWIAHAASPPVPVETRTPYDWRVVVDAPSDSAITPAVRTQLKRDIRTALLPLLGDGGTLTVTDIDADPSPLVKRYVADGWPALEMPEFQSVTPVKTHILRIRIRDDGGILLEARQHDGTTGLLSAVVRRTETKAVDSLGRLTGLLLARDFGPVGVIEPKPDDPRTVRVRFRAGELGPFTRWIREGDILAVSAVYRNTTSTTNGKKVLEQIAAKSQAYTLLRVRTALPDGDCPCDVISRYAQPFVEGKDVIGYRCMKLTTADGPLRVRIVGPDDKPPPAGSPLELWANETGFSATSAPRDRLDRHESCFRTGRDMHGLACLVVRVGAARLERFPLPIVGADEPHTIRFGVGNIRPIRPEELARAEYELTCERLRGRAGDAVAAQADLFQNLARLIRVNDTRAALARATAGLASLETAEKEIAGEFDRIRKSATTTPSEYTTRLLASTADHLAQLRSGKPDLQQKIVDLREVLARPNDPAQFEKEFRAAELTRQIAYHVGRGEIPEALDLYDVLFEATKEERAKTLKDDLAKLWEPKTDDHKQTRKFLFEAWRKATTLEQLRDATAALPKHLAVMETHADKLGLRFVVSSMPAVFQRLKDVVDKLDPGSESDQAGIRQAKEIADAARKTEEQARTILSALEPKKE